METEKSLSCQLTERLRNAIAEIAKVFAEVFNAVWNWIKSNLQAIQNLARHLQKTNERHEHNQHTRSTWKTDWDTRRRHQIAYRKPNFAVARRNC